MEIVFTENFDERVALMSRLVDIMVVSILALGCLLERRYLMFSIQNQ